MRTITPRLKGREKTIATLQLQVLSALIGRAQLAARLGSQYGGDRDLYEALGYKTDLDYEDYATQYSRQDMAKAIINRPIQATWRGKVQVVEPKIKGESPFEKQWKVLWKELQLKSKFIRLDKVSSIGKYGILYLGLDDVRQNGDLSRSVGTGDRKLLYVKPLAEGSAPIAQFETDPKSSRYGLPVLYNVTSKSGSSDSESISMQVHFSRIIHVPGEMLESEVDGVPTLQVVYNRLQDLEKLVGASAEMFWRGARPGFKGTVKEDYTLTAEKQAELETQFNEYEHNLRRFLINEGIDLDALSPQVADPSKHVDIQLQMICAVTGIPKRVLVGSERGELASTEDRDTWLEHVQSRREDLVEPQIIYPFIDFCVKHGILPKPKGEVKVIWPDLFSPSMKERADIGKTRASALQSYMNNPEAATVVPPDVFYEYMLGLDDDEIEHIKELHAAAMTEENLLRTRLAESSTPADQPVSQPTVHKE